MTESLPPLPTFLIAGAPRSGTTWLYEVLARHPDIFLAKPVVPEPKFFLVDAVYERGLDCYRRTWFTGARPGKPIGEKTTNYLESATAAQRIHQHLPGVKLIFLFRNPIDRAYSNYLWSRKNGLEKEDFITALEMEARREATVPAALRFARPHAYYSRGLYADLLEPYLARFERSKILALRFEDIREEPTVLAARVHRFLGVEPRPQDAEGVGVVNPGEPGAVAMHADVRRALAARYAEPNRRLATLLGHEFHWEEG